MSRYERNGKPYPSITEIISDVVCKGEGFWRWKLLSRNADSVSRTASEKGNRIHNLLEGKATGRRVRFPREMSPLKKSAERHLKDKEILFAEKKLYDDERIIAGTPDLVWRSDDGMVFVDDYKSGKKRLLEHSIQLGGYAYLLQKSEGIQADYCRPVYVRENELQPDPPLLASMLVPLFEAVLNVYDFKHGRGPYLHL